MPIINKIFYKNKTPLIELLLKQDNFEIIKTNSLFKKLMFAPKEYPDIYFHQGKIDKVALDMLIHSKKCIVNSKIVKLKLIKELNVEASKIEVSYPSFIPKTIKIEEKKEFLKQQNFDKNTKLIFFTANNLKSAGIKEFIDTILNLNSTNYRVIIASNTKQITNLKFQISKYNFEDKIFLYENYDNIDLLFAVSDIFVLPTHIQAFAVNIVKAMYYKTAVFTTTNNTSSEILDVFAIMNLPNDPSTAFKIDALLNRDEDLEEIKKQNYSIAKQFTIEKELIKIKKLAILLNKC